MKKFGTVLASLGLILGPSVAFGAPNVATMANGSCSQAINLMVSWGYRRSTIWCNGALRSNTWRVHHTNGCHTDITFYNSGDIGAGTIC